MYKYLRKPKSTMLYSLHFKILEHGFHNLLMMTRFPEENFIYFFEQVPLHSRILTHDGRIFSDDFFLSRDRENLLIYMG